MLKATRSTDGGVSHRFKKRVFSANADDVQPVDLQGAREVIFQMRPDQSSGWLTGDKGPLGSAQQFWLQSLDAVPIVFHSNDGRLYFRSQDGANPATLFVWVIR